MSKRILSVFLAVLFFTLLIPFQAFADTTYTYNVDAVNSTRRENYLVIYTSQYGYTTNTNVYGTEVTVVNGIVTSVGGNNSVIPSNGFVVSGHGTSKEWLDANIKVGMKASYTNSYYNRTITFVYDSSSAKYAAGVARDKAVTAKNFANDACIIYDKNADTRFNAAEEIYNSAASLTEEQAQYLITEYTEIAALYREREVTEYRGLWLRPTQKSTSEVENYVKQCYQAGINMICIETMYAGTMIYPTPSSSLFKQNPIFNGFDVLGAFVTACHRYGIELHCWMPVFYSCTSSRDTWSLSVAAKKPEWQLKTNNGSSLYSTETSGMVFLNPALDEVQDFLAETYTHLLKTYKIDGFQLDYIRYRDRTTTDDYGYDATTIAKFKEAYPKYSAYNITYNTNAAYWNDWVNFRAAQVTKFVSRMRTVIDEVAPNVVLSADVGSSLDNAYSYLYQDAGYWLSQKWLDMIHPMAYGSGMAPYVKAFFSYTDEGCLVVPGLGIFMDEFGANDMISQTMEMQDIGCDGAIYFESTAFYSKNADDGLKESLFTVDAIAPAFDNESTITAVMSRFNERLQLAINRGLITEATANTLYEYSNTAIEKANENAASASDALHNLLNALSSVSGSDLRTRLKYDVGNAIAAAARDPLYADDDNKLLIGELPEEAKNAVQLTIDGINHTLTGEDSSLNIDIYGDYNTVYAYNMLLKPTDKANVYTLVETVEGIGQRIEFKTPLTDGMIIAAFHTDKLGSGVPRVNLAKTVTIGSELTVFGVDIDLGTFTYINAMLYVSKAAPNPDGSSTLNGILGDINNSGVVDQYDYILAKRIHFDTYLPTDDEKARGDVYKDGKNDQYDYLLIKRAHFGTYVIK